MIEVSCTLRKNLISKLLTIDPMVVKGIRSQLRIITSKDFKNKSSNDKGYMRPHYVGSLRRGIEKT